jgi:hypothetical protein
MWVTGYNERIMVTVAGDVRDANGKPVPAVFLKPSGPIVLDSGLHQTQRHQAIIHEILEYLDVVMGVENPIDLEGKKNRAGRVAAQFSMDLKAQGGDGIIDAIFGDKAAQEKMESSEGAVYVPAFQDGAESSGKVACGGCKREHYPAMAVKNSEPAWYPPDNCFVMNRELTCQLCVRQTTWVEACTADGTPLNFRIGAAIVKDLRKS